jgi:PmbA protein
VGARPFDAEGAAAKPCALFENGVLKNYLTNSYLARKLDLPHTGHASRAGGKLGVAPSNLVVAKGDTTDAKLLSLSPKVIYISSVDAIHSGFNDDTLDFSLPIHGYYYEDGHRVHPVNMAVMSGNLFTLLKSDLTLGNEQHRPAGNVATPAIFIPSISIAGE